VVEDGAWIGAGALVRNGRPDRPLVVGAGATVGMGAVVMRDVPPGATVLGNPARIVRRAPAGRIVRRAPAGRIVRRAPAGRIVRRGAAEGAGSGAAAARPPCAERAQVRGAVSTPAAKPTKMPARP
jgi:hypothetical protein